MKKSTIKISNKNFKIYTVILSVLFCFNILGCSSNYSGLSKIDNYKYYIGNLYKYSESGEPVYSPPKINGFNYVFNTGFNYAKHFNGNYTFIILNGENYIIDLKGNLYEAGDIIDETLIFDKFIFTKDDLFGVKDIFGNIILNAEFYSVQIYSDTILATDKNGIGSVYVGGKLFKNNIPVGIELYDENTLIGIDCLYSLDMKPKLFSGYKIFSGETEDMIVINDGMLFGFANVSTGFIITPKYEKIEYFRNGFATVEYQDNTYIIDKSGNEIFAGDERIPVRFDGTYLIYSDGSFYGVADENFNNFISPCFEVIQNETVYGDYLIIKSNFSYFYSVKTNESSAYYYSIKPFDNYFIAEDLLGFYWLLDSSLNLVIGNCEKIIFENDILSIVKDNIYYFYTKQ